MLQSTSIANGEITACLLTLLACVLRLLSMLTTGLRLAHYLRHG